MSTDFLECLSGILSESLSAMQGFFRMRGVRVEANGIRFSLCRGVVMGWICEEVDADHGKLLATIPIKNDYLDASKAIRRILNSTCFFLFM